MLEVKNLVKKYKGITAVDKVSFSTGQGICFGLLGPNGAGKTTTLEIIEDIISPDEGEILYKDRPRSSSFREEIGIQFQETALLSFLTVRETLETFRSLYRNTLDLDRLVNICHLNELQNQMNDKISGGQRQRLLLALALINKPELLFLDEPSTGLDPQARHDLWDIIKQVKELGNTIILTTHYMEEAQYLCDEVAIMDCGKLIALGSPEALIKKYCKGITIVLPKKNFPPTMDSFPSGWSENGSQVEMKSGNVNASLDDLLAQKVDLTDMVIRTPNLENVFLNLTGRKLRD